MMNFSAHIHFGLHVCRKVILFDRALQLLRIRRMNLHIFHYDTSIVNLIFVNMSISCMYILLSK
jgi:hypothetical protein